MREPPIGSSRPSPKEILADNLAELIFVKSAAVIIVLQLAEQCPNLVLYFMVQIPNLSATLCSLKNVSTAEEMQA